MSTVKLITPYNKELHDRLKTLPVRVIVVTGTANYGALAQKIFNPYRGKLVILGDIKRGILPVDSHVYGSAAEVDRAGIDGIIYGVMNNSSTRTYSGDGETYYDVYKVWYECRNIEPVRKSVSKLLMKMYGTTDVQGLAPWDDKKTIGEMTEADEDYKKIYAADLHYPIIVRHGGKSVDGLHRLMKCALTGRKFINVVIISGDKLRKCRIDVPVDEHDRLF